MKPRHVGTNQPQGSPLDEPPTRQAPQLGKIGHYRAGGDFQHPFVLPFNRSQQHQLLRGYPGVAALEDRPQQ